MEESDIITNILGEVMRQITFFLVGASLFALYVAGASQPIQHLTGVSLSTVLLLALAWLAVRLHAFRPLLGKVALLLGMAACTWSALFFFHTEEISLLWALIPMAAVMTGGWQLGLAGEAGLGLLLAVGLRSPDAFQLPGYYPLLILAGGAALGVLTWISQHALLEVLSQSLGEAIQARATMAETRQQRLELFQTQEDLLQANRELARLSLHLKALTQVAEEARRVKEEFVANVSHELRTPLNMIIGFSELITKAPRMYGELSGTLLADIAAIQRNSQHLSDLVNDVLDLSQIEAGRMNLMKDWTTLQELVETAVSAVKVLYDTKGLYLRVEMPDEALRVFCDRTRIREVLLNLLSNAGRFTERGGVVVRAWRELDHLVVSVSDTGSGIAPEDQDRLFEPFQQLDNSIRRQGGSGLGLSISRRFVELHNGRMWLESEVGVGTTFHFSLPEAQPVPNFIDVVGSRRWITPYHQFEVDPPQRSRAPLPVVVPRYILMDRGSGLQRLFGRFLGDVEVVNTSDPADTLKEMGRSPANALVVNGATTEGVQNFLDINANTFDTPVVTCWITGFDEVARRLGVDSYLLKPVSREKLLYTLSQIKKDVRTVLLVDDEIEVLQLFGRILASAERNYSVLRARDGRQALEILRERKPDVMLIDLVMPEMDGFQVIKEKANDETIRDIPVVVISSRDPSGAPIVSDALNVTRKGGISARELLLCIQALSSILDPEGQADLLRKRARMEETAETSGPAGGSAQPGEFPEIPVSG